MENVFGYIDQAIKLLISAGDFVGGLLANIPAFKDIGPMQSRLIALGGLFLIGYFLIKPLIKWSLGIIIIGTVSAALISHFSGIAFWGVFPLTAFAGAMIMFSSKISLAGK